MADIAKVVAEDLIKHGKVTRGYIGVRVRDVNDALAEAVHLGAVRGVAVNETTAGGAGEKAGCKPATSSSLPTAKNVNSSSELQGVVAEHHAGDKIVLQIWRNEKQIDVPSS